MLRPGFIGIRIVSLALSPVYAFIDGLCNFRHSLIAGLIFRLRTGFAVYWAILSDLIAHMKEQLFPDLLTTVRKLYLSQLQGSLSDIIVQYRPIGDDSNCNLYQER